MGAGKIEAKEYRIKEVLQRPGVQGFLWGVGAAVAASYVWPRVRGKVRPVVVGAISEVLTLADNAMSSAMHLKEDLEDIVAEAKQRATSDPDEPQEALAQVASYTDAGADEIQDLRLTVDQLQSRMQDFEEVRTEIRELKQLLRQASGRSEGT